jgi:hypothetical protein
MIIGRSRKSGALGQYGAQSPPPVGREPNSGTTFLGWLFQARRKAVVIGGAAQRWSSPWVVLGWVIPVASLWIPRRIVIDVWRASAPGRSSRRPTNAGIAT